MQIRTEEKTKQGWTSRASARQTDNERDERRDYLYDHYKHTKKKIFKDRNKFLKTKQKYVNDSFLCCFLYLKYDIHLCNM